MPNGTSIAMAAPEQPTVTRCPLSYAVSLRTGEAGGTEGEMGMGLRERWGGTGDWDCTGIIKVATILLL